MGLTQFIAVYAKTAMQGSKNTIREKGKGSLCFARNVILAAILTFNTICVFFLLIFVNLILNYPVEILLFKNVVQKKWATHVSLPKFFFSAYRNLSTIWLKTHCNIILTVLDNVKIYHPINI